MTTETMTDLITAEEAKKLLDHYGLPTDCDCNDEDCVKCSHYPTLQERASKKLKEISPNLARTVIALHAQLAEAQAAQALAVETIQDAVQKLRREAGRKADGIRFQALDDVRNLIRSLADPTGVNLLAELRAERDAWKRIAVAGELTARNLAIVEADRDRLAAANAVLEAKVAGLVGALKPFDAVGGTLFSKNWNANDIVFDGGPMRSDCLFFEDFLNLRAALATQEAGT